MVCARMKHLRGAILIEGLIAAVILVMGLLVLGQFHSRLIQSGADSRAASEAVYVAQTKMDDLRALPLDDPDLAVGDHEEDDPVAGTGGREYLVSWNVTAPAGLSRMVAVTAILIGSEESGQPVQATLHSFLAERTFLALGSEASREDPGEGTFERGKYREGEYEEFRTVDGLVDLDEVNDYRQSPAGNPDDEPRPEFQLAEDDVAFAVDETGRIVEIASVRSGDALLLGANGYARISGNILFEISGPPSVGGPATDDPVGALGHLVNEDSLLVDERSLFDRFISIENGICSVFPTFDVLEDDPNLALITDAASGQHYRMLGYSCYVAHGWFGSITASWPKVETGTVRDICTGNPDSQPDVDPDTGEWCSPDVNPACSLVRRASLPGAATLGRAYIGFAEEEGGNVIGDDGTLYVYKGIQGSPAFGLAEYGSVCGMGDVNNMGQGPLYCRNLGLGLDFGDAAFLVPGGHHFLVTDLPASVTVDEQTIESPDVELARWLGCKQAMAEFSSLGSYVNNPYTGNPSRFVCLTPDTCVYLPRVSGFMPNTGTNTVDGASLYVLWQRSGLTLPRFCNTFGEFGDKAGMYWCLADQAILGSVHPYSGDTGFVPAEYYYKTHDGTEPIKPRESWDSVSAEKIPFYLDFTSRNLAMEGTGEGGPGGGIDPVFYTVGGNVASSNVNIKDVTVVGTNGAVCNSNFGNSGGSYLCNVAAGWTGNISLSGLPRNTVSNPASYSFQDLNANSTGNNFTVVR